MIRVVRQVLCALILTCWAAPAFAQTPNTASLIIFLRDPAGALVKDVKVTVVDDATGFVRDFTTTDTGRVTVNALAVSGNFKVSAKKTGLVADDVGDIVLAPGE